MMTTTRRIVGRWIVAGVALWSAAAARADIAATGYFGINVNVPFPFTSGTFDGSLTSFNAGPFAVGGVPVALQSAIG